MIRIPYFIYYFYDNTTIPYFIHCFYDDTTIGSISIVQLSLLRMKPIPPAFTPLSSYHRSLPCSVGSHSQLSQPMCDDVTVTKLKSSGSSTTDSWAILLSLPVAALSFSPGVPKNKLPLSTVRKGLASSSGSVATP